MLYGTYFMLYFLPSAISMLASFLWGQHWTGGKGGDAKPFIICEITVFVNWPIAFDRNCSIRNYPHSPNVMWVKSKVCFPLGKFLCVKQKFAVKKQEHFLLFHGEFFADESRCCIFVFASHEQIRLVEKRLYFMVHTIRTL